MSAMRRSEITEPPRIVTHVARVDPTTITDIDGWTIGCDLHDVQVGEVVEMWGRGIGYTVRGLAVGGRVDRYRTEAEDELRHVEEQRLRDAERRAKFETEGRAELDAAYAALPEAFQRRIDRFRRAGGDEWRWQFEGYEMFCCTEAVKIAEHCARSGITLQAFADLPYDQQTAAGLSDGHSGNTFGTAVGLARLWPNPSAVVAAHGALAVLVGCDNCGCEHADRNEATS